MPFIEFGERIIVKKGERLRLVFAKRCVKNGVIFINEYTTTAFNPQDSRRR